MTPAADAPDGTDLDGPAPDGTDPDGVGAQRSGRRGRRRVIAPATSGQPEETESQAFIPASLEDSAQDDAAPASKGASGSGGPDPDRKSPLSARDRWILEQRPPHWD
ncbi:MULTISPECIES: hypothetical protein [Actinomycetes]|uniref:Uncharacterized protein n=2 Tax=Actinomycetes TaxID=1760 RepID=A0ABP6M1M6_9MICC